MLAVGFAYAALGASIGFSLGIIGGGISGAIQYHKANGKLEGASGDVIKSMSNWTPITTTIGAIAGAAFYAVTTYMAAQGAATVTTDVAGEVVENVADDVVKEIAEGGTRTGGAYKDVPANGDKCIICQLILLALIVRVLVPVLGWRL